MINDSFFWPNRLLRSLSLQPMQLSSNGDPAMTTSTPTTTPMDALVQIVTMIAVILSEMIVPTSRDVEEAVDPREEGEAVVVDAAGLLPGLTSRARFAIKRVTMPEIVGLAMVMRMAMEKKKFMRHMAWIQTGTKILLPLIT
jgi:hypothetical protein